MMELSTRAGDDIAQTIGRCPINLHFMYKRKTVIRAFTAPGARVQALSPLLNRQERPASPTYYRHRYRCRESCELLSILYGANGKSDERRCRRYCGIAC
jgi:hypothetical protein